MKWFNKRNESEKKRGEAFKRANRSPRSLSLSLARKKNGMEETLEDQNILFIPGGFVKTGSNRPASRYIQRVKRRDELAANLFWPPPCTRINRYTALYIYIYIHTSPLEGDNPRNHRGGEFPAASFRHMQIRAVTTGLLPLADSCVIFNRRAGG